MAELSKTARAAMRGGVVAKVDPFDTNAKKIAELRKMRNPATGLLFVNRMDFVDALIEEYDILVDKLRMEIQTNNELQPISDSDEKEEDRIAAEEEAERRAPRESTV